MHPLHQSQITTLQLLKLLEEYSSSVDQLYAQVDKTNKKKASKKLESMPQLEEPSSRRTFKLTRKVRSWSLLYPSTIDQLCSLVDRTNKKKASKKLESTPPQSYF